MTTLLQTLRVEGFLEEKVFLAEEVVITVKETEEKVVLELILIEQLEKSFLAFAEGSDGVNNNKIKMYLL